MLKTTIFVFSLFLSLVFYGETANAHFGLIIPSQAEVMNQSESKLTLNIAFSHPAAGNGMDMEKPEAVCVNVDGKSTDLSSEIHEANFLGKKSWRLQYDINRPGVYQFTMSPAPYFEPLEDTFIIHYAKVTVPAFGAEDGWNEPIGLPVEIIPLTRPFGIYSGSVFQGLVLRNGKPVPWCRVEIENLNENPRHEILNDYFETQVVLTDSQGIFTAGIPWGGWWGFAALHGGDEKIEINGQKKDVELGGVLWVNFATPKLAE